MDSCECGGLENYVIRRLRASYGAWFAPMIEPCSVGAEHELVNIPTGHRWCLRESRGLGLPIKDLEVSAIRGRGFQQFSEFLSGALAKGILGNRSAWTFIEGLLDSNFVVCMWILLSSSV